MQNKGFLRIALLALLVILVQGTWVLADTTGRIEGKVTDQNGNGIVGARVTASSPGQTSSATTVTNGFYDITSLSPDTFAVTASKDGYDTSTVYGVTVTQNQTTATDIKMRQTVKTIGHITTTATATVVSKTVTGDLYAVNAKAISSYQGGAGGAETLYSQNSVAGSLPGVVRYAVGAGPGYGGQGQLSMRGGAPDQVGYELEGVPLNRGFDFYNGTTFNTNGLASLQVYTGGAPADAGRAMSGYVNEVISRGRYPGGADFTAVVGSPLFGHTIQADVYGGTPDSRFTYYVSTLASNIYANFGDRSNLANTSFTIPANDPGCTLFNAGPAIVNGQTLNCAQANILSTPVSLSSYGSNPFAAQRDTATNLNWSFPHNGLNDNLQAVYVVGTGLDAPYGMYGNVGADPAQATTNACCNSGGQTNQAVTGNQILWPIGFFYQGQVGQPYNPALVTPLTWPSSGGSYNSKTGLGGVIPPTFQDSQSQQYSIELVGYTHALTQGSFLKVTGYKLYSYWTLDQPINQIIGATFYQLHDNATGVKMDYENQINQQNLIKIAGDWSRDLTLRYNYGNYIVGGVGCASGGVRVPCSAGTPVTAVPGPFSTWSTVTPLDWSGVISDQIRPSDKFLFDVGARWDYFGFQLMPMIMNGSQGLAVQGEMQQGQCLDGYAYSASDPKNMGPNGTDNCNSYLINGFNDLPGYPEALAGNKAVLPGAGSWQDATGTLAYTVISPRFGFTFNADPRDVIRVSAGRYVQPPNSAFEQYRRNPAWGPGTTLGLLNSNYLGLGFGVVHNILPEDSTNYDISWEHEFSGGLSAKITPYYRNTRNQILSIPFNPASPSFVTGDNFGNARIKGFEFFMVKNVTAASGIGGTLAVTFTDSTIHFNRVNGSSFVDLMNGTPYSNCSQGLPATGGPPTTGICGYNNSHPGANYALLDPNGYYHPSFVMSPNSTGPSYAVPWVINLGLDARTNGFDILPTFNFQSGNPYGEPLNWAGNPDPYTKTFDSIGGLKGPSWWTVNLAVSRDIGHNLKASILGTNLISGVHNQGYAWEMPTGQQNISYGDNGFYQNFPAGAGSTDASGAPLNPNPATAYYGTNYYGYAPAGALPVRDYVFSLSAKI
jgi:hypothetical protein